MLSASHSYGMDLKKDDNPSPGSNCLFGRYAVWEEEDETITTENSAVALDNQSTIVNSINENSQVIQNHNSDKQPVNPCILLLERSSKLAIGGILIAFFLALIQSVTQ